ncbi:hypothetical protein Tco_1518567 [Tanacetum coccineum]
MPVELGSFDVIIGMDWLRRCHAVIVCEKLVQIPYESETLTFCGNESSNGRESRLTVISCSKAQEYMAKGCQVPVGMTKSTSSNHYVTTSTNDNIVLPEVTNMLPVGMTISTSSNHYGTTSTNDNIIIPGVTNMIPVVKTISTSSNHYSTTSTNDNIILPGVTNMLPVVMTISMG